MSHLQLVQVSVNQNSNKEPSTDSVVQMIINTIQTSPPGLGSSVAPRKVSTPNTTRRLGLQPDGRNTLWELWEGRIRDAGNRFTRGDMTLHDYNAFIRRAGLCLGLEAQ